MLAMSKTPKAMTDTGTEHLDTIFAHAIVVLLYVSYIVHLLSSFAVRDFISETSRLINKFVF